MRPLYSWPLWKLRLALAFPYFRALWAEAWLELHDRAVDAAEDASDERGGPWLVRLPPGMH